MEKERQLKGYIPSRILKDICNELTRAEEKHPRYPQRTDPVRRVGIIVEECGEAMREALDMTRPNNMVTAQDEWEDIEDRLYKETVEIATTAIRLLKAMQEERS